jgi:hypothetical protein
LPRGENLPCKKTSVAAVVINASLIPKVTAGADKNGMVINSVSLIQQLMHHSYQWIHSTNPQNKNEPERTTFKYSTYVG